MNKLIAAVFGSFMILSVSSTLTAQYYVTYADLESVKIDYITEQCGEEPNTITEFNFLRLTNKTTLPIFVSFKVEYYYNGVCSTCNTSEYQFTFNLSPNGVITSNCSNLFDETTGRLAIIKSYVNRNFGHPLDRFELTNITVQ